MNMDYDLSKHIATLAPRYAILNRMMRHGVHDYSVHHLLHVTVAPFSALIQAP